jgi:hypothetical protein
MNELLALEISNPSTSAETVATTAIDTETRLFVSSVRWCGRRRRLSTQPANAPAEITAKTTKPMDNGCSIIEVPPSERSIARTLAPEKERSLHWSSFIIPKPPQWFQNPCGA